MRCSNWSGYGVFCFVLWSNGLALPSHSGHVDYRVLSHSLVHQAFAYTVADQLALGSCGSRRSFGERMIPQLVAVELPFATWRLINCPRPQKDHGSCISI